MDRLNRRGRFCGDTDQSSGKDRWSRALSLDLGLGSSLGATSNPKQASKTLALVFGKGPITSGLNTWGRKEIRGKGAISKSPVSLGGKTDKPPIGESRNLSLGNYFQARKMLETKPSTLAERLLLLPSPGEKFYPPGRQSKVIHSFIQKIYLLCSN